jgi:hypothetical protein
MSASRPIVLECPLSVRLTSAVRNLASSSLHYQQAAAAIHERGGHVRMAYNRSFTQTITQTRHDVIVRKQAFRVAWPSRTPDDYKALTFACSTNEDQLRKAKGRSEYFQTLGLVQTS